MQEKNKFETQITRILTISFIFLLSYACTSYKEVPYMQDLTKFDSDKTHELFEGASIKPKDLLNIIVTTPKPELAVPFNLTVQTAVGVGNTYAMQQPVLMQYLVDTDGNVEFPVLGTLHVGGMKTKEVEEMLKEKLLVHFPEKPIVNVRFVNYTISVLGEVTAPGIFPVQNEKINVFQALALAKDMTIWGKRTNVKLLREDGTGKQQIIVLDLTDPNIVNSPYYYLQQNDILYVTPNKTRTQNADIGSGTTIAISAISIVISAASLVVTILKK